MPIPLNIPSRKPQSVLNIDTFVGGLNNRNAATEIGNNESPDLLNVEFTETGALSKRRGVTLVGDDKGDKSVNFVFPAYYGNGSAKMLMFADSVTANTRRLFYRTTGNWTELTSGGSAVADTDVDAETFYDGTNQMVFIIDGTNFQKFDPSANTLAAATASPASVGKILKLYKNRLYSVGSTTLPERIYFSDLGDGDAWTVSNYFDVPSQNITEKGTSGDPITALSVFQDRLVIFKNRSIWTWDGTSLRQISDKHGCVGKRAVCVSDNYLFFADNDGVYRLSGNFIEKVSKKIQATWDVIPAAQLPNVAMAYFEDKLFVATAAAGASTNNILLVNYTRLPIDNEQQQPWVYWKGTSDSPMAFSSLCVYEASTTTAPVLVGSCFNTQTVVLQLCNGNADYNFTTGASTVAISSYYLTKVFSLAARFKKMLATYKVQAAASLLQITAILDFGKSAKTQNFQMQIPGTSTYGTGVYGVAMYGGQNAIIGRTNVSRMGKFVQYQISNPNANEPFTLYKIQQIYNPIRLK